MKDKKIIILLIIIVLLIAVIIAINIKNNENENNLESNIGEGRVVQNSQTEMYEVYDGNGELVTTLEDDSMKEIYESNPYFDPDPTN